MSQKKAEIPGVAVLAIGWDRELWPILSEAKHFRWDLIQARSLKERIRQIWDSEAVAAVIFVGPGEAVDAAIELLHRLRSTGPPVLVAVAEVPDAHTEKLLRQTGAIYLCGHEAQQRLMEVLRELLCEPGVT